MRRSTTRTPVVQRWNLTIERDLGFNTGLRLSYDGNLGSGIGYVQNLNQVAPNTIGYAKAKLGAPFPLFDYIAGKQRCPQ